jgi:DNA invertase Pin-like site-specific DNA recombinase
LPAKPPFPIPKTIRIREKIVRGNRPCEGGREIWGRAPTARANADQIRKLAAEGAKRQDIAVQLGIGVASVYRVLKES